jgi:hypothetical protein
MQDQLAASMTKLVEASCPAITEMLPGNEGTVEKAVSPAGPESVTP